MRPIFTGLLLTVSVLFTSAANAEALGGGDRVALARFSLAAGQADDALRWLAQVQGDEARMVRARALLASGETAKALELLRAVTRGEYHRGEAWLLLARHALEQGDVTGAAPALQQAVRLSHGDVKQQAQFLQAELYREQGQLDRAGQVLSRMDGGYWSALGYFNIAAAYSQTDRSPSRALVAIRVALAMTDGDDVPERAEVLRSELLVKAGYLAYQDDDYQKAIGFLEDVPLTSYAIPQALYFHGLALSGKQNYRAAMQSWHRAKKYPLAFPGAVDAWLGMGRGYDELGYLGQAGEAYLAANAAFESERVTLKTLASQVRDKGAYGALVEASRQSDVEWFLADSRTLTQPRLAYLLRLAEQAEAQDGINRIAELKTLAEELAEHSRTLRVFQTSIEDRLATTVPDDIGSRQGRLDMQVSVLAERVADLATQASPQERQGLVALGQVLADIKHGAGTLDHRARENRRLLRQQLDTSHQLLTRVDRMAAAVDVLIGESEAVLDTLALTFIAGEDERILYAQDRTEQHIAHLYEHLALRNIERGAP